jgi:hypothetical protein
MTITVRGVTEEIRDALTETARSRGQSLQAYLLGVLRREAGYAQNAAIIAALETDLLAASDTAQDAPTSAEILTQVRREREEQLLGSRADDEPPRS